MGVDASPAGPARAPSRLEIEITEAVPLPEDARTVAALHELRALGVRIAMDDLGTGHSSLSHPRSFPFAKIKIDQSFIRGLGATNDAEAIVRAITALGRNLGMTVTAEGVETQARYATLRAQGCSQLQGCLFSRPKPAGDVRGMIEGREVALPAPAEG